MKLDIDDLMESGADLEEKLDKLLTAGGLPKPRKAKPTPAVTLANPHCGKPVPCQAGTCRYPQPCNSQTLRHA